MTSSPKRPKAKFTMPLNTLKAKVGEGGIPAETIMKGDTYIQSNPVDFTPTAQDFLTRLEHELEKISQGVLPTENSLSRITDSVMQLKSNGAMFHYHLISMTSDVLLRFMEKVEKMQTVNNDLVDIMKVYVRVLHIIISRRMTGDCGPEGHILTQELHAACLRYQKRYAADMPS